MAKPKTNLIIQEDKFSPNLFRVWTPTPAATKEPIEAIEGVVEAIEGVVEVYHSMEGYLNVWFNPCYDKDEIRAEIKVALADA